MSASLNTRSRAAWTANVELLFLVGSPRSGTTWLQAMLSSHPAIYTGPETFFFATFAQTEKEFLRPKERRIGLAEYLSKDDFYRFIGELFWLALSALPEAPAETKYFLEKTTNHCVFSDFILKTFPSARFVHIIRDPRAVVASILRASESWGKNWAPSSVREATKMWSTVLQHGKNIKSIVQNPDQYIEIKYEDLRADPGRHLSSLFYWLGLETCSDAIAEIVDLNSLDRVQRQDEHFNSIPITASSAVTPIANLPYPDGFFGPAPTKVEDIELSWLQRARVETLVGNLIDECGYTKAKTFPTGLKLIRMLTDLVNTVGRICTPIRR